MKKFVIILLIISILLTCSCDTSKITKPMKLGEGVLTNLSYGSGAMVTLGDNIYSTYNLRLPNSGKTYAPYFVTKGLYYYFYGKAGECGGYETFLTTEKPIWWDSEVIRQ
jgi:hypothetical protein